MGKIIEGYWDCDQCNTKGIKGRFRSCSNCGKPRGKDTTFYMKETDEYVEDKICKEPDWYCSYCESLNSAESSNCESCGSSREDSEANYFALQEEKKQKDLEETKKKQIKQEYDHAIAQRYLKEPENKLEIHNVKDIHQTEVSSETIKQSNIKFNLLHIFKRAALITFPFLLVLLTVWAFIPKPVQLKIIEKSWERSIVIEEYKTVNDSGWYVPGGGRVYSQSREIHHYDEVLDHYETKQIKKSEQYISGYKEVVTGHRDLGNGYFEEITTQKPIYDTRYWTETVQEPVYKSVPVYQTKYYYEIERWVRKETVVSEGTSEEPFWPEINLLDNERQGNKNEQYFLTGINQKDKEKLYTIEYSKWNEIDVGDNIEVKTSLGVITEVLE